MWCIRCNGMYFFVEKPFLIRYNASMIRHFRIWVPVFLLDGGGLMTAKQRNFLRQLYLSVYDFLVIYVRSTLPNAALAEEAVQEAFAIAHGRAEQVCSSSNPKGQMVAITASVIRDVEERQKAARALLLELRQSHTGLSDLSDNPLDLRALYGDVADTEEFLLVYAMAIEGKSRLQLAKQFGISVDTCKVREQQAIKFLQNKNKFVSPFSGEST